MQYCCVSFDYGVINVLTVSVWLMRVDSTHSCPQYRQFQRTFSQIPHRLFEDFKADKTLQTVG